jgi:hypothetical protein
VYPGTPQIGRMSGESEGGDVDGEAALRASVTDTQITGAFVIMIAKEDAIQL